MLIVFLQETFVSVETYRVLVDMPCAANAVLLLVDSQIYVRDPLPKAAPVKRTPAL